MIVKAAVLVACVAAFCSPAAGAHASSAVGARVDDRASTTSYLRSYLAYARGLSAKSGAIVLAIEGAAQRIDDGCASVLVGAPHNKALEQLGEEVTATLVYSGAAPDRAGLRTFARGVEDLEWTSAHLTRLVRGLASEELAVAELALPNVCADLQAWKAGGFGAAPASTIAFLGRVQAITASPDESSEGREAKILRALEPYEGSTAKQQANRADKLQAATLERVSAASVAALSKVEAALGLTS